MKNFKGKEVPITELTERRILIEINRGFLHTLGMHLQVDEHGNLVITREDKFIHYGGFTDSDREALQKLHAESFELNAARRKVLGYTIQPIQSKESQSISRMIEKAEKKLLKIREDIERVSTQLSNLEMTKSKDPKRNEARVQQIEYTRNILLELQEKEVNAIRSIETFRSRGKTRG